MVRLKDGDRSRSLFKLSLKNNDSGVNLNDTLTLPLIPVCMEGNRGAYMVMLRKSEGRDVRTI